MAFTKLYLTNRTASYTPATLRGAWDDTAAVVTRALDPSKYGGGLKAPVSRSETDSGGDFDMLLYRGISGPLASQTITGDLDVLIATFQSSGTANAHYHVHVYVTQGDSDTPRGTLLTDYTEALGVNEWTVAASSAAIGRTLNAPTALASLAVTAGDRLVVEIGVVMRNTIAGSVTAGLICGTLIDDGGSSGGVGNVHIDQTAGGVQHAAFLTFSNSIAEVDSTARTTRIAVRSLSQNPPPEARVTRLSVRTLSTPPPPIMSITQLVLEVACSEDADDDPPTSIATCNGGGSVAAGTNPDTGTELATATTPLVWMELTIATGSPIIVHRWAKAGIPHGLPKSARVLEFGTVTLPLSDLDGGPESATISTLLSDVDGVLRALWVSGTIRQARVDYFVADLTTLKGGSPATPWRLFRGYVSDCRPEGDRRFRLVVQDALSARLNAIDGEPLRVPTQTIENHLGDLPNTDVMFDKPASTHLRVGLRTDWGLGVPVRWAGCGAWHGIAGGAGLVPRVDRRRSGPRGLHRRPRGDSGYSHPTVRVGVRDPTLYVPGKSGWIEADVWSERDGRRYTLIAGSDGSPAVRLAKEGRIPLVVNVCGYDTIGDGSDVTINSPSRALLHLANNYMAQDATGDWLPIDAVNGESLFDTETFEAVHTVQDALGYACAGVVGGDYQAKPWTDVIAEFCRSFGTTSASTAMGRACWCSSIARTCQWKRGCSPRAPSSSTACSFRGVCRSRTRSATSTRVTTSLHCPISHLRKRPDCRSIRSLVTGSQDSRPSETRSRLRTWAEAHEAGADSGAGIHHGARCRYGGTRGQ